MNRKYPAYDPEARCPKCGYDCVATKHLREEWSYPPTSLEKEFEPRLVWPEHLERRCVRCDYAWREATVAT
jgi:hypothetical protein